MKTPNIGYVKYHKTIVSTLSDSVGGRTTLPIQDNHHDSRETGPRIKSLSIDFKVLLVFDCDLTIGGKEVYSFDVFHRL